MALKHIYWFAYYNTTVPSVRYRAFLPLYQLAADHGISYDFVFPSYRPSHLFHFIKVYFEVLFFRKPDSVIVFQKIHTAGIYFRLLKYLLTKQSNHTIYDIDDAEYTRRPVDTIHYFMQHCHSCFVGSEALKTYAEQFSKNVFLLTSPVKKHQFIKQQRNPEFTIGWIGYFGAHYAGFQQYIFPILSKIPFPVTLIILGIKDFSEQQQLKEELKLFSHVHLVLPLDINWQKEKSIYSYIRTFDIGISPLPDTTFNRAKSAYKLKQYLSCGIPVLGTPVGENVKFLQEGLNGYFCNSAQEFYDKIIFMRNLSDVDYADMSKKARAGLSGFTIEKYNEAFIHISENLLC